MVLDALRFTTPLYTLAEAARIVDVPASTLSAWVRPPRPAPRRDSAVYDALVSCSVASERREPSITFVGLAEALVLSAIRRSGVPMQRIRPAIVQLEREIGVAHALASRQLYTDGAELMFDFAQQHRDTPAGIGVMDLVVLRNSQRVFADVITGYLRRIEYGADNYPVLIRPPAYVDAEVIVDPRRAFGAPIFERGGARVEDVLQRFWTGESIGELTQEFGVPADQLEDVLRVASRRAA